MLKKSTALRNLLLGKIYDSVVNGSFDSDTSGWTPSNANLSIDSNGYDGNCCKITNSSDAAGKMEQDVTVNANELYHFECYAKAGDSGVIVKVGTTSDPTAYVNETVSAGSWTKVSKTIIPTEATVRITFELVGAAQDNYGYADEVKLYRPKTSIKDLFTGGTIRIFTGTQPGSADNAPTGTLLVTITASPDGIHFEEASNGVLSKKQSELWSGTAVADGVAGWFRLSPPDDDDSAGDKYPRIDGAVGTSGAELNMSNTNITAGSLQTISAFTISIAE